MKTLNLSLIILIWLFFLTNSKAQHGYSSASVSQSRTNGISSSKQIIVEEFMNYHKHNIQIPASDEEIALDIQWGNKFINSNSTQSVLQVGIATENFDDYTQIPPLNLALVIDKSSSMNSDYRLEKVKAALDELVKSLRPTDILSIVTYDNTSEVLIPSQAVGNGNLLKLAISSIQTGGSTNLNEGMVTGYKEVLKNYKSTSTNRVILLTDGCANTGVTDPEQIIKNSLKFNQQGIGISTIGVGYGVNYDLLSQISKNGKGANHFIGESEDIQKVFIDEVESLLSPIAKNVTLEIMFDNNLELQKVYGYSPILSNNKVLFNVNDINSSLTQIFILKFNPQKVAGKRNTEVVAKLKFFDIKKGANREIIKKSKLIYKQAKQSGFLANKEVKRNYAISMMAQNLKEIAQKNEERKYDKANQIANKCLTEVYSYYPKPKEKNITRVLSMVKKYQLELKKMLAQE